MAFGELLGRALGKKSAAEIPVGRVPRESQTFEGLGPSEELVMATKPPNTDQQATLGVYPNSPMTMGAGRGIERGDAAGIPGLGDAGLGALLGGIGGGGMGAPMSPPPGIGAPAMGPPPGGIGPSMPPTPPPPMPPQMTGGMPPSGPPQMGGGMMPPRRRPGMM